MKKSKKVCSALLAAVMLLAFAVCVNAAEDYCLYSVDGMARTVVSSSYSPDLGAGETSLLFDHRTGTSCTLSNTVSLYVGSRESEIVDSFAVLADGKVRITMYATDNAELTDWVAFKLSSADEDGDWSIYKVDGIERGYAFYRFDLEVADGESAAVAELALFHTDADKSAEVSPVVFEREMWRKVPIVKKRFFGIF